MLWLDRCGQGLACHAVYLEHVISSLCAHLQQLDLLDKALLIVHAQAGLLLLLLLLLLLRPYVAQDTALSHAAIEGTSSSLTLCRSRLVHAKAQVLLRL